MPESVGDRIYQVRRALGPDARTELPLRAFAALLTEAAGRPYYDSELSKMERGKRGVSLDDIAAIASVDPLNRGAAWIAWGDAGPAVTRPALQQGSPATHPSAIAAANRAAAKVPRRGKGKAG